MTKADKEGQRKTPILRFKGFTDDWEQRKLSELTQQVKRTRDSENPILTISAKNGWMDQKDRFNRVIAGKELKNYIELYENELSYNHGNSKYAKFGIIYVQRKYKKALVPKVYHSFSMTNGDPRFIENLSLGHKLDKELSKLITSGARQDGLLNINKNSFYSIKLFIPSEQEQIKISNIMDILNHIITLYERKLKLLSQIKKYFLDNLFAEKEYPNLRFKGFTGAWEQRKLGAITDTYSGGTPQVSVKGYYSNNEIPFIRSSDIHKDKTELYISSKGLKNSSAKLVSKGYILYALYGATSGEVDISKIDGAINQAVLCINAHDDLNYFLMLFLSKNKDKIVRKYIQGGQGNLSASIIKKIKVFTTSKLEETKISNLIKTLSDIITLYEDKQQHLTEIKNTLLNTMFI